MPFSRLVGLLVRGGERGGESTGLRDDAVGELGRGRTEAEAPLAGAGRELVEGPGEVVGLAGCGDAGAHAPIEAARVLGTVLLELCVERVEQRLELRAQ